MMHTARSNLGIVDAAPFVPYHEPTMALTLRCTVCGSPTEADAGALRAGFTSCRSCGTIHRVSGDGLAVAPSKEALQSVPDGVRVKEQSGSLQLTARTASAANVASGPELIFGLIVGIAAGYGASLVAPHWFFIPFGGLLAFFATTLGASKLRRFPPPVTLSDGVLRSGVRLATSIPVGEVDQVYTTEYNPNMPGFAAQAGAMTKQADVFWVCALRKNGKRVQMVGPLRSLDHALYIEERLEAALGLADRSVVGDLATSSKTEEPAQSADAILCDGCGAEAHVDDHAKRRGFVLCSYCRTATVVRGDTLGDVLTAKKEEQYRVDDGSELRIVPLTGDAPVLLVSEAGAVTTPRSEYPPGSLDHVVVRMAGEPSVKGVLSALGKVGNLGAYTARNAEEAAALVTEALDMQLQIAARAKGKGDVVLLDAMESPREAFALAAQIRERLS